MEFAEASHATIMKSIVCKFYITFAYQKEKKLIRRRKNKLENSRIRSHRSEYENRQKEARENNHATLEPGGQKGVMW